MTKRITHIIFGLGISMFFIEVSDPIMLVLGVVSSLFGGTVPDWDGKVSHRKVVHNIFALTLTSTVIILAFSTIVFPMHALNIALPYFLSYSSHLLLDILTGGVKLLFPFNKRKYRLTGIKYDEPAINTILQALGILMILVKLEFGLKI
ncbi:MAG: metal-dependent hydrolase [Nitrososphaeria archaeon]